MTKYEYAKLTGAAPMSIIYENRFETENTGETIETQTSDRLEIYNILGERGWRMVSEDANARTATFMRARSEMTSGSKSTQDNEVVPARTFNLISPQGEEVIFKAMHKGTNDETLIWVDSQGWEGMHIVMGTDNQASTLALGMEYVISNDNLLENIEFFMQTDEDWTKDYANQLASDQTINIISHLDGGYTVEKVFYGNRLKAAIEWYELGGSDVAHELETFWNLKDAIESIHKRGRHDNVEEFHSVKRFIELLEEAQTQNIQL